MASQNPLRFEKDRLLCVCGNGVCEYLPLKNDHSLYFYKCLAPNCSKKNFLKYDYEVRKDIDKFIDVPYCGGCGAGLCRVRRVKDGENAGRILFSCTIKEGQGPCRFKVYEDDLVKMRKVDPSVRLPLSPLTIRNDINHQNVNLVMEKELSWLQEKTPCESSTLPRKRLHNGDSTGGASRSMHSMQADCLVQPVNNLSQESSDSIKNHPGAGTSTLSPCNKIRPLRWQEDDCGESSLTNKVYTSLSDSRAMGQAESLLNSTHSSNIWNRGAGLSSLSSNMNVEVLGIKTSCYTRNVPSREELSGVLNPKKCTSQSVSTARGKSAGILEIQNLLSYLETRDPKDHEAMRQKAESTFKVLDGMFFDSGLLKQQVYKLIESARSLQSKEVEFSSADAELKDKKKKFDDACQELDDTSDVHGVIKIERDQAQAAFECARSQLRR